MPFLDFLQLVGIYLGPIEVTNKFGSVHCFSIRFDRVSLVASLEIHIA